MALAEIRDRESRTRVAPAELDNNLDICYSTVATTHTISSAITTASQLSSGISGRSCTYSLVAQLQVATELDQGTCAATSQASRRAMQTTQNAGGAQSTSQAHQFYSAFQEGVGAPFPQPQGSSAAGGGSGGGGGGQNVLGVLALTIGGLHDSTSEKFAKMDTVVRELGASLSEVREAMHTDLLKLAEWQDKAHERQMKASMLILERVRVLERTIGDLRSLDGEETITRRLQRMDCALTELLEQVQDPHAARTSYFRLFLTAYTD